MPLSALTAVSLILVEQMADAAIVALSSRPHPGHCCQCQCFPIESDVAELRIKQSF
jgi:hypothetical protein